METLGHLVESLAVELVGAAEESLKRHQQSSGSADARRPPSPEFETVTRVESLVFELSGSHFHLRIHTPAPYPCAMELVLASTSPMMAGTNSSLQIRMTPAS